MDLDVHIGFEKAVPFIDLLLKHSCLPLKHPSFHTTSFLILPQLLLLLDVLDHHGVVPFPRNISLEDFLDHETCPVLCPHEQWACLLMAHLLSLRATELSSNTSLAIFEAITLVLVDDFICKGGVEPA